MPPQRKQKPGKLARVMPFPLRLDPTLRLKLQTLADADRRSLTNYILRVLDHHIAQATRDGKLR
jgi:hypothetical protein